MKSLMVVSLIAVANLLTGCQTMTPPTPPSTENTQMLNDNQLGIMNDIDVVDSDGDGVADGLICVKKRRHIGSLTVKDAS